MKFKHLFFAAALFSIAPLFCACNDDDNEIEQKIAEITGAKCKETWLTGQTAQEAVGTLIAGGEYPDMIDGGDGMKQLYDAGALVALDDYLDAKVFAGQKGTKMDILRSSLL
jgi:ABC-type glycerol-3-phosphate transport system substrate-binding protein